MKLISQLTTNLALAWLAVIPISVAAPREDAAEPLLRARRLGSAQNAAFSPERDQFLFTSFRKGYNKGPAWLCLAEPGAKRFKKLLAEEDTDNVNLPGTSWNEAIDRITFASDRAGPEDIWMIAPEGGSPIRITTHSNGESWAEPSFSPDGRRIVFEAEIPFAKADIRGSIRIVPVAGGEPVALTNPAATGFDDRQPNWSPTGAWIVFQRRDVKTEAVNLYRIRPNGSNLTQITSAGVDTDASWSPDGRWLVFSSDRDDLPRANLWVVSIDGGAATRATTSKRCYDGAPSWSPDGQWLAFESGRVNRGGEPVRTSLQRVRAPELALPLNLAPTNIVLAPARVSENATNGTLIGTVYAEDPNAGDLHIFTLLNDAAGRFSLEGNSTNLIAVANSNLLDFELNASHSITIVASDNRTPRLSSTQSVSILVTDIVE